ncbi:hypothetical protein GGQ88_001703 [Novosphingobium hassiacum]|uniref:Uncharacterized protein n=1 Tax=Novosphingobium hassiacum TaxID=173676 RepID=A0A7W5ZYA5_9SPHN|nr:hypothetical protein [Novosphingobium hassiacum]MBB3860437.1 hypothetical protein [Novosphingobium hassiacum]
MADKNKADKTGTNQADKPELRDKVDAAKARLAERTGNARPVDTVKSLIEEHPVASLAAGILLGALIAKALPSSGRMRSCAVGLATLAGKYAVDYAGKAAEAGREGLHKVEEVGGSVGTRLADVGGTVGSRIADGSGEARRKAVDFAEIARSAAADASEIAIRKVNEIASRLKH